MEGAQGLLHRHHNSPRVQRLSQWVRPVIAMMMTWLTWSCFSEGVNNAGLLHTLLIGAVVAVALLRLHAHPAFTVLGALVHGGVFLG